MHGAEGTVPVRPHIGERRGSRSDAAEPANERARISEVDAGSEGERDLSLLTVREVEHDLHRQTRIEAGADPARQMRPAHARRPGEVAVATDDLEAVTGVRAQLLAAIQERGAPRELAGIDVAGQQRAAARVDLGDHVGHVTGPVLAEYQLEEGGQRQPARSPRAVGQLEQHELEGRIGGDEGAQLAGEAVLDVFEDAVTEAVAGGVCAVAGCGCQSRRPVAAIMLVAEIERLAAAIADRVVVPGRETVIVGVLAPRIGAAALADYGAEVGVGEHIDPRRGRATLPGGEDDVLAAVRREAAVAVPADEVGTRELGRLSGRADGLGAPRPGGEGRHLDLDLRVTQDLIGEAAVAVDDDQPRDGLQQHLVLLGDLVGAAEEDTTWPIEQVGLAEGRDDAEDLVV